MRGCMGFCVVLAVVAVACGEQRSSERVYRLQGQILSVEADRHLANIKHEEIKGFMDAMTMTYRFRDDHELAAVAPGDLIDATLVVLSNDAYLKDVKKVG